MAKKLSHDELKRQFLRELTQKEVYQRLKLADCRPDLLQLYEPGGWAYQPDADPDEKPLDTRERSSLLVIIAALAGKAGINLKRVTKASIEIEAEIARIGASLSARAIETLLKKIPDALERKGK